jgi:hypothetical protein
VAAAVVVSGERAGHDQLILAQAQVAVAAVVAVRRDQLIDAEGAAATGGSVVAGPLRAAWTRSKAAAEAILVTCVGLAVFLIGAGDGRGGRGVEIVASRAAVAVAARAAVELVQRAGLRLAAIVEAEGAVLRLLVE